MDQVALVDREINDGQRLITALIEAGFPVTAAFWLKTTEDGQWTLYIATPIVDSEDSGKAYRRMHPVYYGMTPPLWLDRFRLRMIAANDPMTQDVLDLLRRYQGRNPGRFPVPRIGGVNIDEVYLYPLPRTANQQSASESKS